MAGFAYDVRDLKFILNEWLDMEKLLDLESFKDNYGPRRRGLYSKCI